MFFDSGSSFSSSSSRCGWSYDVFLSFRGKDTRKNFTSHLYSALVQAGIHTFRDDQELPRGKEISPQLLMAIKESRISIVVFSKGYASSRWCLDELVEILEWKRKNKGKIVLPIFYDIDPSDVRKQSGSFKEAFHRHEERFEEEMDKVNKWREALNEAGNLSGLDLKEEANGHEAEFIRKIVKQVSNQLDRKYLSVPAHLVGIDFLVCDIVSMLLVATNDVRIVGIHGMSGIGKTTVAKVIFNRLCDEFEGGCFLLNVGGMSKETNGLVQLQDRLLCDILKPNVSKFSYVDRGIDVIKERLCYKRVLVVLDDVDQPEQLHALVGERSWFGRGSRIIITSRDEHLLTLIEVDEKFQVHEMSADESVQLFSWHAFRDTHPMEDYVELSNTIVKYAGGLPLALEVLGSYLFRRNIPVWKSAIEKLEKIPHHEIYRKLRISFDALDDDKVKGTFLDIACFFVGWDKDYVEKILDGRGFFPGIGIDLLIERSLLKINYENVFEMHNLLRDMGREVIREKAPDDPGSRSRIWNLEDGLDVLKTQTGTKIVEGLALDIRSAEAVSFCTESFTNMRNLKLLQINGVHLHGSYEHFPKQLTWFCWLECPLKYLPSSFQLNNVTILDMQHSNLCELWKETEFLNKLKILNLSHSVCLTKTPNFLGLFNLERLVLEDCPSLIEVHQSIRHLRRLVVLNLAGCCRLKILPESMGHLKSLEILNINMCSRLEKLPECLGDIESLTELLAYETAITQLPSSIGNLTNLKRLSLGGFNYSQNLPCASRFSLLSSWLPPRISNPKALLPASFSRLGFLRELRLNDCDLSEDAFSNIDLSSLHSLVLLNLSRNKFFNLPTGIGCLPKLGCLQVNGCTNLASISELPSSLTSVEAKDCTSMVSVSIPPNTSPAVLVRGCQKLMEIRGMERASNSWYLSLSECNDLSNSFKKSILQEMCQRKEFDIVLVGGEIPSWFSHASSGEGSPSSVSFKVPNSVSGGTLEALLVWAVVCSGKPERNTLYGSTTIIKHKSSRKRLLRRSTWTEYDTNYDYHSWVHYMTWTELLDPCVVQSGEELDLELSVGAAGEIKKCGIHMVVKRPHVGSTDSQWKSCLIRELQLLQFCAASTRRSVRFSIPDHLIRENVILRKTEILRKK